MIGFLKPARRNPAILYGVVCGSVLSSAWILRSSRPILFPQSTILQFTLVAAWICVAAVLAVRCLIRRWAQPSGRPATSLTALVDVLTILGFILLSMRSFNTASRASLNTESYRSCGAPTDDFDGYTTLALYFAGKPYYGFEETRRFKITPGYSPFLTRVTVAFSPGSNLLASAGGDGMLKFWTPSNHTLLGPTHQSETGQGGITRIAFTEDGSELAVAGRDGSVVFYSTKTFLPIRHFATHHAHITAMALSPDGRHVLTGGFEGTIRLWTKDGIPASEPLWKHEGSITAVDFSPDGDLFAASSSDWQVSLWRRDGTFVAIPGHDRTAISGISFYRPDRFAASLVGGGTLVCTSQGEHWGCEHRGSRHTAATAIAVFPSSERQATGSGVGTLDVQDPDREPRVFPVQGAAVTSLVFTSADEVVTAGRNGRLVVTNLTSAESPVPVAAHRGFVPGRDQFGLPDYVRQPGYPYLLYLYMRLTGAYNSCAALIVQPLLLLAFVLVGLIWMRMTFGSFHAFFALLPLLDKSNWAYWAATIDMTEFTQALFYPVMILLFMVALFRPKRRAIALFGWTLALLIISQVKVLVSMFFAILVGTSALCIAVRAIVRRDYHELKNQLMLLCAMGVLAALCPLVLGVLQPEPALFNQRNVWRKLLSVPVTKTDDALLLRYKDFQAFLGRRHERLTGQSDPDHLVPPGEIEDEIALASSMDELAVVDPENRVVYKFSTQEYARLAHELPRQNPRGFLRRAITDPRNHRSTILLASPLTIYPMIRLIWLIGLGLGFIVLCSNYGCAAWMSFLSMAIFGLFLAIFHFLDVRYWVPFSFIYYFTFGAGYDGLVRKAIERWSVASRQEA